MHFSESDRIFESLISIFCDRGIFQKRNSVSVDRIMLPQVVHVYFKS